MSGRQIFVSHIPYTWKRKRRVRFVPWCLALGEERRLRVIEKIVLKGIFGLKRDKVTGEWRRLHNDDAIWKTNARMGV